MGNLTSTDLFEAAKALQAREDYNRKYSLERLKETEPFSSRLNKWIEDWYNRNQDAIVFVSEDDFNPDDIEGTLKMHIERYEQTGKIHVWTGSSDKTIFGEAKVNHMFRAWHDYIHISQHIGYDIPGEVLVCEIQKAQLPDHWILEKELIQSEVVGQVLHFDRFNEFVKDQRRFTVKYIQDPSSALIKKH